MPYDKINKPSDKNCHFFNGQYCRSACVGSRLSGIFALCNKLRRIGIPSRANKLLILRC
jgi:hypothetical protein